MACKWHWVGCDRVCLNMSLPFRQSDYSNSAAEFMELLPGAGNLSSFSLRALQKEQIKLSLLIVQDPFQLPSALQLGVVSETFHNHNPPRQDVST
jgi:hypothetical protein